jgi:hypothetical protein
MKKIRPSANADLTLHLVEPTGPYIIVFRCQ